MKYESLSTIVVLVIIMFGAILAVCTDDEYYEEDAFDYDAWWQNNLSELLSLAAYLLLITYFILATRPSKNELQND